MPSKPNSPRAASHAGSGFRAQTKKLLRKHARLSLNQQPQFQGKSSRRSTKKTQFENLVPPQNNQIQPSITFFFFFFCTSPPCHAGKRLNQPAKQKNDNKLVAAYALRRHYDHDTTIPQRGFAPADTGTSCTRLNPQRSALSTRFYCSDVRRLQGAAIKAKPNMGHTLASTTAGFASR